MARTVTDEEFVKWLANTEVLRVVLGEFDAYVEGNIVTHRIGTEFFTTKPDDDIPNVIYEGNMVGDPTYSSRMTEAYGGSTTISFGSILIDNANGYLDEWITSSFAGRRAILKIGDPSWRIDDFRVIFDGVSDRLDVPNDDQLEIFIKDKQRLLDLPIPVTKINETEDSEGVPKPIAYGHIFNAEPVLDDQVENRYYLNDGPIESVDKVYIDGKVTTAYSASLADGYITLNSEAGGQVTADFKGSNAGGFKQTITEIAAALVERAVSAYVSDALAACEPLSRAYGSAIAGIYITDRINLLDALDSFGTGYYYGFTRTGEFYMRPLEEPADPVLAIDNIETYGELGMIKGDIPIWKSAVGYKKNWTVQNSVADGVPHDHKHYVSKDFTQFATKQDATIKEEFLIARQPAFIPTPLIDQADAQVEAERLLALFGKQRYVVTVSAYSRPLTLSIGETITLYDGRYGLSDGMDFVVVGITEHLIDSKVDLELWR